MVNRNLLRQFDGLDEKLQQELDAAFSSSNGEWLPADALEFRDNQVVTGRVMRVSADGVWVDVGYKSEGVIELREWYDEAAGAVVPPTAGDTIEVLVEAIQDENGAVVLSYRMAKRQKEWDRIIHQYKEGDSVSGVVTRKIKGGLLVNIGASVFLPASQVDIRRPADIGLFIGKTVECKILVIDQSRRNIVVSRRNFIEDQRKSLREKLLAEIAPGQIRKGIVRNIAQFGAFVDLGGIDGLLHVSDMSWARTSNPNDMVKIDEELEVFIIRVDKEKEKIALGLKQKTQAPGHRSKPSTRSAAGIPAKSSTSCRTAPSSSWSRVSRG
jgi:small subunit ribosomal protein S1